MGHCNTYLQDTNEMNGSFDIVPKSHRWTDFEMGEDGQIDNKYIKIVLDVIYQREVLSSEIKEHGIEEQKISVEMLDIWLEQVIP